MAKKRTKKQAKQRIDDIPQFERLLGPKGRIIGKGARSLGKLLVELDPLDRLDSGNSGNLTPEAQKLVGTSPSNKPFQNIELAKARREAAMNRTDAIKTVINDPKIKLDQDMMNIINDDNLVMMDDGRIAQALTAETVSTLDETKPKKKKRSKYNIELTKQLNKLKSEKPRTEVIKLMSLAHKRTRKALGMPPKSKKSTKGKK